MLPFLFDLWLVLLLKKWKSKIKGVVLQKIEMCCSALKKKGMLNFEIVYTS